MTTTFITGTAFGAAMVAAGFHHPSVVIAQLKFENFHMFQAFLTATASSAVVYAIAAYSGYLSLAPRSPSFLGLTSSPHDGNILGGTLLGIGMALSGSCPGTLLAQTGAGVRTGLNALQGALIGGVLYSGIVAPAIMRCRKEKPAAAATTLCDSLGVSRPVMLVLLETVFISVVAATTAYLPAAPEPKLLGVVGGLLIGGAQLLSLLTRRSMIGVSGSYEEAGGWFWWLLGSGAAKPGNRNMIFSAGVVSGAWGLGRLMPELVSGPFAEVSPLLAAFGGALMVIGSRIAGGCTSGHGISGISLLSTSSVITIASCFAAGAVVAPLVH